jgi:hypothetical protein
VKGGAVCQTDGLWYQNGSRMEHSPLEQALEFKRLLLERLADANCEPPAHGVAVAFPDVAHDDAPTQDDLAGVTLDGDALRWHDRVFLGLVDRPLPPPRGQRGNWIEHIHRLWGETWIPRLTLAMRGGAPRTIACDSTTGSSRSSTRSTTTPVSWSMARPAAASAAESVGHCHRRASVSLHPVTMPVPAGTCRWMIATRNSRIFRDTATTGTSQQPPASFRNQ